MLSAAARGRQGRAGASTAAPRDRELTAPREVNRHERAGARVDRARREVRSHAFELVAPPENAFVTALAFKRIAERHLNVA